MIKLTESEKKILERYEASSDEDRSNLREEVKFELFQKHAEKFGQEILQFYGLLDENKGKTFIVQDWFLFFDAGKLFLAIITVFFYFFRGKFE